MARSNTKKKDATPPLGHGALNKALKLHEQDKLDEAVAEYRKALQESIDPFHPDNAIIWSNLGTALRKLGHLDASLACTEKALELVPDKPSYLTNYGNILTDLDRQQEALSAHAKAYEQNKDDFLIHKNYAASLREFGHFEHSLAHYKKASELEPENNFIKWDIAITHLHMGHFKEGWEAFEYRWKIGEMRERPLVSPKWNGEPLEGKTILVHGEQGFGDTILCSRYIPMIKMRGARVIFECKKPLHKLFSKIYGIDRIEEYGETDEKFDYQIPVMSLPGVLKTDLSRIPPIPEFNIPKTPPKSAKALLKAGGDKLKVGVVWSGSITFKGNRKRAVSVERFIPLAGLPGVQFYSLQKGPCEHELYDSGADGLIWDLSNDLNDFTDTAAILNELDLVIMTDSSVAHVAGSIGTPVWNLLNYKPYWLYLSHREDCPWYPSMKLIRQKEPGNWDQVFDRVGVEIEKAVTLKKAGLWNKEINNASK